MEHVEIRFNREEWKYICAMERLQKSGEITAAGLCEATGDKEWKARSVLSAFVKRKYLTPKPYRLTQLGIIEYQKHRRWLAGIHQVLKRYGVPSETMEDLSGQILFEMGDSMVAGMLEQSETAMISEIAAQEAEVLDNTDFLGRIKAGIYDVGAAFLDPADTGDAFSRLSPVGGYFSDICKFIVLPPKGMVEFTWEAKDRELTEVQYSYFGMTCTAKPEGTSLRIPTAAFKFTYLSRYKLLAGKLNLTVLVQENDEAGENSEREYRVRLEIPVPVNRSCSMQGNQEGAEA